jgi:hypothetical protein
MQSRNGSNSVVVGAGGGICSCKSECPKDHSG